MKTEMPAESVIHRGDTIHTSFSVHNPYPYSIYFKDKIFPVSICACFFTKKTEEVCPIISKMNFSVMLTYDNYYHMILVIIIGMEGQSML